MKTFFISDTHFRHGNIIKYCDRPFANLSEMEDEMIKRWNETVGKNDIVWHLGDFCFGSKTKVKNIVSRLNGKIHLVMGNHDGHTLKTYYDCGFQRVFDRPVLIRDFFILSHKPVEWIGSDYPMANIFGHVHNNPMFTDASPRSVCVCVERCDYRPISFEEVKQKMEKASENL